MRHPRYVLCIIALCAAGSLWAQAFDEVASDLGITGGYGFAVGNEASGVSFVDFNNDGWDDLTFCTETGQALKIYQNNSGTFQQVTFTGINGTNEKKTTQWVDYDNDGDQDLYIVFKPQANKLFRNNGNMTFTDVTASAGLPNYPPGDNSQWMPNNSASFCDYDHDGDLDFYVSRYWMPGAVVDTNSFYRNNGNGTFTDVTTITGTQNGMRQSFCATFFDYDNDGWEDMYVINDRNLYENSLYRNNGNGTFTDVSAASGTNLAIDAMNAGIGDFDHNGYMDIYITNSGMLENGPAYLLANQGDGTFLNVADTTGTDFNYNAWGGNFFDYDHDLDLDLYVCTSSVGYETPNAFYVNQANGTFTEPLQNSGGLAGIDTVKSLTNVIGDFNNDGLYDIAVCNDNVFSFHLWENNTVTSNHWFKLFLTGTHANRDAIGTWIEMWIDGEKYIRSIQAQEAYCGQNSKRLIMSTGTHTTIDSLIIKWPIKVGNVPFHKQVIPGSLIAIDTVNTITEPTICHLVTSPFNSGLGSLRAAVECAQSGDTITILLVPGDTITLTGTPIVISKNVIIKSGNSAQQYIRAPVNAAAFTINSGRSLNLTDLSLLGAKTIIDNYGTLILKSTDLRRTSGSIDPLVTNHGQAAIQGAVEFQQ